jgi:hypothetical protein
MLRQLLRTGVAGRSLVASLASPAALASAFASAPVVAAPQRDFAKRRVERRSKKIVKMPDAVDLHQIRMQREARYIAEDEAYVEPRPSPIGDALINAHTILERTPIVIPKIPQWELTWLEREDRMSALGTVDLPMAIKKGVYGKNTYHSRVPTGIDYLPNYTEDDAANNRQSIYRKIDRPLYLIVKVKNTSDRTLPGELWQFPVGNWRAGETLRKAAERGVFYSLGEVSSYYLGNAPVCALEQPVTDSDLKKEFPAVKNVKVRRIQSSLMSLMRYPVIPAPVLITTTRLLVSLHLPRRASTTTRCTLAARSSWSPTPSFSTTPGLPRRNLASTSRPQRRRRSSSSLRASSSTIWTRTPRTTRTQSRSASRRRRTSPTLSSRWTPERATPTLQCRLQCWSVEAGAQC